jgi:hypothetical protein
MQAQHQRGKMRLRLTKGILEILQVNLHKDTGFQSRDSSTNLLIANNISSISYLLSNYYYFPTHIKSPPKNIKNKETNAADVTQDKYTMGERININKRCQDPGNFTQDDAVIHTKPFSLHHSLMSNTQRIIDPIFFYFSGRE